MPISELPLGIFPSEAAQKMEDPRRSMRSGSVRGGGRKTLDEARKFSGMFMDKWTGAQGKKYFFGQEPVHESSCLVGKIF